MESITYRSKNKISPYTTGYGSLGYRVRYYNAPLLKDIARICLRNGVKTISDEWLSELDDFSLALWYQDDGSWGKDGLRAKNGDRRSRTITFSTEGFDLGSTEKLCSWLNRQGFIAKIRLSKKIYHVISLNHSSTVAFWKRIAPYVFIRSKIDLNPRPGRARCDCGALIEPKLVICHECVWKKALLGECHRPKLVKRFGTSSIEQLRKMTIINPIVDEYWIDPSTVGTEC